jgi:hypothetical protein
MCNTIIHVFFFSKNVINSLKLFSIFLFHKIITVASPNNFLFSLQYPLLLWWILPIMRFAFWIKIMMIKINDCDRHLLLLRNEDKINNNLFQVLF